MQNLHLLFIYIISAYNNIVYSIFCPMYRAIWITCFYCYSHKGINIISTWQHIRRCNNLWQESILLLKKNLYLLTRKFLKKFYIKMHCFSQYDYTCPSTSVPSRKKLWSHLQNGVIFLQEDRGYGRSGPRKLRAWKNLEFPLGQFYLPKKANTWKLIFLKVAAWFNIYIYLRITPVICFT